MLDGNQSTDRRNLVSLLESRSGVPSPVVMSVIRDSASQFTIHITAESAINASLVAVSYQSIEHEGNQYPCYGREFMTEYWGENVSLAAGESTSIVKTVSNTSVDGIVAWLEEDQAFGRFTAHEVIQAADSLGPQPATPTPEPTSQPGTPTPTPTQNPDALIQELELSSEMFHPGDLFELYVNTMNPGTGTYSIDQYIALQVLTSFYFWPSWETAIDSEPRTFPAGYDDSEEILTFNWPSGTGSFSGLAFWVVAMDKATGDLAGPYDSVEFGYTE